MDTNCHRLQKLYLRNLLLSIPHNPVKSWVPLTVKALLLNAFSTGYLFLKNYFSLGVLKTKLF